MSSFHFTKILVFKRMEEVVGEAPSEPIVSPSVEVAGDASSDIHSTSVVPVPVEVVGDSSPSLSGSVAPAPAASVLPVVEVRDDLPLPSPVVDVRSGSSSSSPVMETRADPRSLFSNSTINSSTSIHSQGEGEDNIRSCKVGPREHQKGNFQWKVQALILEGPRRVRRLLAKKLLDPIRFLPSRRRDRFPTHPIRENILTSNFVRTN
ncbi:hypothetical protein Adt_23244 [Abeliophyllum distichum]|uniref:Uncharacterized protein n=1 Tax=Abeliophyllum distichum TaxID=126358 RepID=A0ABD1SDQ7_9LAMI